MGTAGGLGRRPPAKGVEPDYVSNWVQAPSRLAETVEVDKT